MMSSPTTSTDVYEMKLNTLPVWLSVEVQVVELYDCRHSPEVGVGIQSCVTLTSHPSRTTQSCRDMLRYQSILFPRSTTCHRR